MRCIILGLLCGLWLATTVFLAWKDSGDTIQAILLAQLLLAGAYLGVFSLLRRRWARIPIALVLAVYVLLQFVVLLHHMLFGSAFNLAVLYDYYRDFLDTSYIMFGAGMLVLFGTGIAIILGVLCWLLLKPPVVFERKMAMVLLAVCALIAAGWLDVGQEEIRPAFFPHIMFTKNIRDEPGLGTLIPQYDPHQLRHRNPVFILQLESVNALAVAGLATKDETISPNKYMPVLREIAQGGVSMPFTWSGGVITIRGQASILCSAVVNLGGGLEHTGGALPGCLPALLKAEGYYTIFQSAFWWSNFGNTRRFMHRSGFKETHFADMMKKGDRQRTWGYDDCIFYDRAFDTLQSKDQKLFEQGLMAYFAVSSNHVPFSGDKNYRSSWPFEKAKTRRQTYLNSMASQDHCLKTFVERARSYRPDAHIFIVSDHPFPLGIHGSYSNLQGASSENFLVPMVYLPPLGDTQYVRGKHIDTAYAQTDIAPTVLELLSGTTQPNSLVPFLKTTPNNPASPVNYDHCHVVSTQASDGLKVAVIRGKEKITYHGNPRMAFFSRLDDLYKESKPYAVRSNISYADFKKEYLCARYRSIKPII